MVVIKILAMSLALILCLAWPNKYTLAFLFALGSVVILFTGLL